MFLICTQCICLHDGREDYPFIEYAKGHWFQHALEVENGCSSQESLSSILRTLCSHSEFCIGRLLSLSPNSRLLSLLWLRKVLFDTRIFHNMASQGLSKIMSTFLSMECIDYDLRDSHNRTPLFYAADKGKLAAVSLLLEKGAEPDSKDNRGRTPLSHAAGRGHTKVIERLLE